MSRGEVLIDVNKNVVKVTGPGSVLDRIEELTPRKYRRREKRSITFSEYPLIYTPRFIACSMGYAVVVRDSMGENRHEPYPD